MTKYQALILYGLFIIVAGISLIVLQDTLFHCIPYTMAACMMVSAAFAALTAYKSKNLEVRFKYHELHAIGMAVYGIAVLFFAGDNTKFLYITSFFLMYYGITEIIFCFILFSLKHKLSLQILLSRLAIGFLIYLGSTLVLIFSGADQREEVIGYGCLFILSGIHILLYQPIVRKLDTSATTLV